jgi:AcrR family transcriptional regulator
VAQAQGVERELRFRLGYGTVIPVVKIRVKIPLMAPMPAATRSLRSDARRNRERIVDAARAAFAEQGPDAQIDDIARRAEVGVGTVYRHFPTKDALMAELVRLKLTAIRDRARRWLAAGGDPGEAFAGFLREQADVIALDAALQRMLWPETEETWAPLAPLFEEVNDAVGKLIARAQEAGAIRADLEVDDVRTLMCGLGAIMAADARGVMQFDWRRQLEFMLDGLRAR